MQKSLFLALVLCLLGGISAFNRPVPGSDCPVIEKPGNQLDIQAQGAILINQASGKVLYSKNSNTRLHPASTTKILTALLAIENGDLNEIVTIGDEIKLVHPDSTKAGLSAGEKITIRDLIYGLMLPSGNDAAYATAVYTARKTSNHNYTNAQDAVDKFVDLMNKKAQEIGAKHSNFGNPDGYKDNNHYTTGYDMAMIAKEAMKNPFFKEVVASNFYPKASQVITSKENTPNWKNTNKLIDKNSKYYYANANGIKTGHTAIAGHCLVSSASKGNLTLISVVFNSTETGKWTDSISLLEYGFANNKSYINLKLYIFVAIVIIGLVITVKYTSKN